MMKRRTPASKLPGKSEKVDVKRAKISDDVELHDTSDSQCRELLYAVSRAPKVSDMNISTCNRFGRKFQLFQITTKIVGKQHHHGEMNDGETVYLERECDNPYDCNAIRVLNSNHDQVGYILAEEGPEVTTAILAPIMDYRLNVDKAGGDLDAVVISGCRVNPYDSGVDIVIVGTLQHSSAIERVLRFHDIPYLNLMNDEDKLGYLARRHLFLQNSSQPPSTLLKFD